LLRAAAAAATGKTAPARSPSGRGCVRGHRDTACAAGKKPRDAAALQILIDQKFDSLDEILRGLAATSRLTPRISDLIVSYGERLSSHIVAAAFRERASTRPPGARDIIITDSQFSEGRPQDDLIEKRAAEKIRRCSQTTRCPSWAVHRSNEAGITTHLGRGRF